MEQWGEIRRQATVVGRITDLASGAPIAAAQVTVTSQQPSFRDWLALKALAHGGGWDRLALRPDRTLSADDGRFCFIDLPDGTYTLTAAWVTRGSRYGTSTGTATVARGIDGTVKLATVDLALPSTRVSGRVSAKPANGNATETPVAMAEVWIKGGGEATFTDAQGLYVLAGVEPGQRTVRVRANGLAAAEARVTLSGPGQSATTNFSLS